jgi:diguanylate cyclase (GGDEF)-like protein
MILVVAAAALNAIGISVFHPDAAAVQVAINGAMAGVALAAYAGIATFGRRRPEALVFAVLFTVDAATIALAVNSPGLGLLAVGYLLVLPMVVALVIPWEARIHVGWLALHAGLVVVASWTGPEDSILASDRYSLYAVLAVATTVSQFGHVTSLRARVASFMQIADTRALHRHARRDAIRLDRLNDLLELSSMTDELTKLKNRLGLTRDLAIVRSRIERLGQGYGLLMLDLDRFKAINDSRGHLAGDDVLRATAIAIAGTLRPGDTAYRYGGEEFVVLLALKAERDALVAAERIRKAVAALDIPNAGNEPSGRMTISAGVAVITSAENAADDDAWLARADAALYRAKAAGRNRCEVSG